MPISHFTAVLLGLAAGGLIPLWAVLFVAVFETLYYEIKPWSEAALERYKPLESGDSQDGRSVIRGFERE